MGSGIKELFTGILRGWTVSPCRIINHWRCQLYCCATRNIWLCTYGKGSQKEKMPTLYCRATKTPFWRNPIGKRIGSKNLSFLVFGHADFLFSDEERLYISWTMCHQLLYIPIYPIYQYVLSITSTYQYIPSWTGFNIKIHDRDIIMESNVHYLPCLDAPAT